MPELPEVEIIRLGLSVKIVGLKVQKVQVLSPKSFIGNPNLAEGKKVVKVWRRAKMLGLDLNSDQSSAVSFQTRKQKSLTTLLFHLKMSGQLIYEDDQRFIGGHPTEDMLGKMPNLHTRVIFSFAGGSHLYFNDQRKFGWVKIVQSEEILGKLGPEPLEKDFTWEVLKQNLLGHKSLPVKAALMDQAVVAGVGNIYSNEACFLAGVDPRTKTATLSDKQFQALYHGIIKALRAGIKHGGSTRANFVDPEGCKGYFLDYAFVYSRDKHPCKVCGTMIKKVQLGGRGTYFCPSCQI